MHVCGAAGRSGVPRIAIDRSGAPARRYRIPYGGVRGGLGAPERLPLYGPPDRESAGRTAPVLSPTRIRRDGNRSFSARHTDQAPVPLHQYVEAAVGGALKWETGSAPSDRLYRQAGLM